MAAIGRVLALALALAATARPADACSNSCIGGSFLPGGGATIPANAPGFLWQPTVSVFHKPSVRLLRASDQMPVAITFDDASKMIQSTEPLVVGAQYILEEVDGCQPNRAMFTVAEEAPVPTSLGSLRSVSGTHREEISVDVPTGGCSSQVDASIVTIEIKHSDEALPWKDLLVYETMVDGARWHPQQALLERPSIGASWQGRGRDRIFHKCVTNPDEPSAPTGLAVGSHLVEMRARLPGGSQLTTPVKSFELSCDSGCSTSRPGSFAVVLLVLGLAVPIRRRSRLTSSTSVAPARPL